MDSSNPSETSKEFTGLTKEKHDFGRDQRDLIPNPTPPINYPSQWVPQDQVSPYPGAPEKPEREINNKGNLLLVGQGNRGAKHNPPKTPRRNLWGFSLPSTIQTGAKRK